MAPFPKNQSEDIPWRIPLLCTCMSLALYTITGLPDIHWQDTGEFISAAANVSLTHPPGHPLTLLTLFIAQQLPWGDLAWRSAWMSGMWVSFAVWWTYILIWYLHDPSMNRVHTSTRSEIITRIFNSASGALLLPLLPLVWLQGIRPEVYAAQLGLTAFILGVTLLIQHQPKSHNYRLILMYFALGCLCINHTLLALCIILPVGIFTVPFVLSSKVTIRCITAFISPLSLYSIIWIRGTRGNSEAWGWIDTLPSLTRFILGIEWTEKINARFPEVDIHQNLSLFFSYLHSQIGGAGMIGLALALSVGAFTLPRRNSRFWTGLTTAAQGRLLGWLILLSTCIVLCLLTKLCYPFNPINPDFSGYLSIATPATLGLLLLILRAAPPYTFALLCCLSIISPINQIRSDHRAENGSAARWGRSLMSEVPPRGLLILSNYESFFIASALKATEGWRNDITLVFRGHQQRPWYLNRLTLSSSWWAKRALVPAELYSPYLRLEYPTKLHPLSELDHYTVPVGLSYALNSWSQSPTLSSLKAKYSFARGTRPLDREGSYAWALYHQISMDLPNIQQRSGLVKLHQEKLMIELELITHQSND